MVPPPTPPPPHPNTTDACWLLAACMEGRQEDPMMRGLSDAEWQNRLAVMEDVAILLVEDRVC